MVAPLSLLNSCAQFASEVSPEAVQLVVDALAEGDLDGVVCRLHGDATRNLKSLLRVWSIDAAGFSSKEVAYLIAGAAHAFVTERANRRVEVVWSGPAPVNSVFRNTGPALLELIDGAKDSIHLVTFAAYRVPAVSSAIHAARRRGVRVVLVMESEEASAGKISFNGLATLQSSDPSPLDVYVWPISKRTLDSRGRHGTLHAKFAVADRSKLLVSSANLTEYAFELNIELGVLLSGGPAPAQAANQIESLIRHGVLQPHVPV